MKIPKLVIQEATNLKKFATKEEIARLNFSTLRPEDQHGCIYGQMTGVCYSTRATELIAQCAKRVYEANETPSKTTKLNGSPIGLKPRGWGHYDYYSPIEVWITRDIKGFNERLIKFLKDEIKSL